MADLPVACALNPAELAWRRDTLLPGIVARAQSVEPLPDARAGVSRGRASSSSPWLR